MVTAVVSFVCGRLVVGAVVLQWSVSVATLRTDYVLTNKLTNQPTNQLNNHVTNQTTNQLNNQLTK